MGATVDAPQWRPPLPGGVAMTVTLEPAAVTQIVPVAEQPDGPALFAPREVTPPVKPPAGPARALSAPLAVALKTAPLAALPQAVDLTYYPADALDVYPKPVMPLALVEPASVPGQVLAHLRLSLHIDEHGVVNRVSVVRAEPAGANDETLSTLFAGTRFSPAIKDGRPVRSHVHIDIRYGAGPAVAGAH